MVSSPWKDAPTEKRDRSHLDWLFALPGELVSGCRWHYWRMIHHGRQEPFRMLIVDSRNWQVGRHVYAVPVLYERDLPGLLERHGIDRDGYRTEIVVLHWGEFLTHFPVPMGW